MLFRKYLICIFLLIPFTSFADQYHARVIKVVDGDTIWVKSENKHIKIRLSYIDAPEIKQQCKKPFLKISAIIGFEFNKNYSCGVIAKKN